MKTYRLKDAKEDKAHQEARSLLNVWLHDYRPTSCEETVDDILQLAQCDSFAPESSWDEFEDAVDDVVSEYYDKHVKDSERLSSRRNHILDKAKHLNMIHRIRFGVRDSRWNARTRRGGVRPSKIRDNYYGITESELNDEIWECLKSSGGDYDCKEDVAYEIANDLCSDFMGNVSNAKYDLLKGDMSYYAEDLAKIDKSFAERYNVLLSWVDYEERDGLGEADADEWMYIHKMPDLDELVYEALHFMIEKLAEKMYDEGNWKEYYYED